MHACHSRVATQIYQVTHELHARSEQFCRATRKLHVSTEQICWATCELHVSTGSDVLVKCATCEEHIKLLINTLVATAPLNQASTNTPHSVFESLTIPLPYKLQAFFLNFSNAITSNKSKDTHHMLLPSQNKRNLSENVLLTYVISTGARI